MGHNYGTQDQDHSSNYTHKQYIHKVKSNVFKCQQLELYFTSATDFFHRYLAHLDQHSISSQYDKEKPSAHTEQQHELPAITSPVSKHSSVKWKLLELIA